MVKNNIRKSLLEQGHLLSEKFFSDNDPKIQKIAIDKINLKSSKNNLLYFPFRREVKLDLLMNTINNFSNKIYMPRIFLNKDMKFNLLSKNSIFRTNK